MSEIKKPGIKMKVTGYICIAFAFILSLLMLIPGIDVDPAIGLPLVYFWTGTGITLLFGNAGKRIGGELAMNKQIQDGLK